MEASALRNKKTGEYYFYLNEAWWTTDLPQLMKPGVTRESYQEGVHLGFWEWPEPKEDVEIVHLSITETKCL